MYDLRLWDYSYGKTDLDNVSKAVAEEYAAKQYCRVDVYHTGTDMLVGCKPEDGDKINWVSPE